MKIIGEAYRELQDIVKKYAKENYPVLFCGEPGTGKELFMRLYMESSSRTGKKHTINCAAFSDDLLRSEVFGHERGAFTGAIAKRSGRIAACNKGILALDEIGDATREFQAAILRVSEANSYSPVGSDEEKKTDTLIIAATNKPESLRDDLKGRFHILPIPPLQKEDIPALARHFLNESITEKVINELKGKKYKGNIRGLKRACESLKAERGDDIYDKKKKQYTDVPYRFDYNRYSREILTWDRYIKPLIDKYGKEHNFDHYKYKYHPFDGDSLEWILCRDESLNSNLKQVWNTPEKLKEYSHIHRSWTMYEIVSSLKNIIGERDDFPQKDEAALPQEYPRYPKDKKKEAIIKDFKESIEEIFKKSSLPYLLGYIHLRAERPNVLPPQLAPTPNMSYLFDRPLKQAEKEFINQYIKYNRNKHTDKAELEVATGMTKKALDQKFRRYNTP